MCVIRVIRFPQAGCPMVAAVVARGRPVGTIRQTYVASAEDRCAAGEAAPAPGELELAALPLGGSGLAWLASATSWGAALLDCQRPSR